MATLPPDQDKQASSIPEAIQKDRPKLTHEMPGPIGSSVRSNMFNAQLAKDYASANSARAKNFADKNKDSFVISKEDVRNQTKGLLTSEFSKNNGKDLGR